MTNSRWRLNSRAGLMASAVLVAISSGCTPWQLAKSTLFTELNEYPRVTDARLAYKQYAKWAREEWRTIATTDPETYSSDYMRGFVQGFTSFVHHGGNTDPPPVPPRRYWRVGYKNARGKQAIQEWYNGYAHGATVAHEKGYRERSILPSSVLLGYNTPQTAPWETAVVSPSSVPPAAHPSTQLNEPTLADPRDRPTIDPSQSDPFVDDPESLPNTLPVPDPRNETDVFGDLDDGESANNEPTIEPEAEAEQGGAFDAESELRGQREVEPEPELESDEEIEPGFDSEPGTNSPSTTNEFDEFDQFDNFDGFDDSGDVFDDLPEDDVPELDDTGESAFNRVVPKTRSVGSFDIQSTPPRPPWLAETVTAATLSADRSNSRPTLPEATPAVYSELRAEPPSDVDRFEQVAFQSSLPEEWNPSAGTFTPLADASTGDDFSTEHYSTGASDQNDDLGSWKPR